MTTSACPNNIWNHTHGCTCVASQAGGSTEARFPGAPQPPASGTSTVDQFDIMYVARLSTREQVRIARHVWADPKVLAALGTLQSPRVDIWLARHHLTPPPTLIALARRPDSPAWERFKTTLKGLPTIRAIKRTLADRQPANPQVLRILSEDPSDQIRGIALTHPGFPTIDLAQRSKNLQERRRETQ